MIDFHVSRGADTFSLALCRSHFGLWFDGSKQVGDFLPGVLHTSRPLRQPATILMMLVISQLQLCKYYRWCDIIWLTISQLKVWGAALMHDCIHLPRVCFLVFQWTLCRNRMLDTFYMPDIIVATVPVHQNRLQWRRLGWRCIPRGAWCPWLLHPAGSGSGLHEALPGMHRAKLETTWIHHTVVTSR